MLRVSVIDAMLQIVNLDLITECAKEPSKAAGFYILAEISHLSGVT